MYLYVFQIVKNKPKQHKSLNENIPSNWKEAEKYCEDYSSENLAGHLGKETCKMLSYMENYF